MAEKKPVKQTHASWDIVHRWMNSPQVLLLLLHCGLEVSRRPELPVTGPGKGGRVGASATQHIVQNLVRDTTRDEDPREALLKYAKMADEDPQWTAAWRANQPKPVFAEVEKEADEDEAER